MDNKPMPIHEDIDNRFNYHPPANDRIVSAHEAVREGVKAVAHVMADLLPNCRERSIALTKLEEAMFAANAAIARHHEFYK